MIPQRLDPVKDSPEILTAPNIPGLEIDCRTEQNADEIRKRYNNYYQQTLIRNYTKNDAAAE